MSVQGQENEKRVPTKSVRNILLFAACHPMLVTLSKYYKCKITVHRGVPKLPIMRGGGYSLIISRIFILIIYNIKRHFSGE